MISKSLPLVEIHRHLDGAVRLQTILDLGLSNNLPLPAKDLEGLRPFIQVNEPQPGVMAFIARFQWMVGVMVDYDAVRRISYESVEDASNEGLDYVELRFSPWFMAQAHQLDPAGVVEAVVDGVASGQRDFGVLANLIGILSRTYGPTIAHQELEALRTQSSKICALDLAGDEGHFPASLFEEHFRIARETGWHITIHAGEIAGSESIWQALKLLKAERIGHALSATDDPRLMDYLAEHRIGIESCLTSNVQTSCVQNYASHPIKAFLDHGIPATINTDDPGISAITLPYEYESAAPRAGLTSGHISKAQINALEVSFLPDSTKKNLTDLRKKENPDLHKQGYISLED